MMNQEKRLVSVSEYAKKNNIDRTTVYRRIKSGKLQSEEKDGKVYVVEQIDVSKEPATKEDIERLMQGVRSVQTVISNLMPGLLEYFEKLNSHVDSYHEKLHEVMETQNQLSRQLERIESSVVEPEIEPEEIQEVEEVDFDLISEVEE